MLTREQIHRSDECRAKYTTPRSPPYISPRKKDSKINFRYHLNPETGEVRVERINYQIPPK